MAEAGEAPGGNRDKLQDSKEVCAFYAPRVGERDINATPATVQMYVSAEGSKGKKERTGRGESRAGHPDMTPRRGRNSSENKQEMRKNSPQPQKISERIDDRGGIGSQPRMPPVRPAVANKKVEVCKKPGLEDEALTSTSIIYINEKRNSLQSDAVPFENINAQQGQNAPQQSRRCIRCETEVMSRLREHCSRHGSFICSVCTETNSNMCQICIEEGTQKATPDEFMLL